MNEYIEVGQSLQFTDPNTPTRVGEIVENVSDIYNIPSPRLGMQVFVKSEKKSFVITSLKSKVIGGVDVPEAAVEAFEPVGAKSITWNNDTDPSNMNDFVVAGVYDIKGEHTRSNDNLPITNTGGGHTFNARLTVLDSSITGSGKNDDKCITQVMSFNNRLGQGEVYIRTGKGASLDNLAWEKWSTLQRNVNVEEVGSLDDLKDNGIYSGVWLQGSYNSYPLTFVCVVINDYFIGIAPRRVSQFVYGLSKFDGSVVYQSRVWDDSKGRWGDWDILNKNEISSMIESLVAEIKANAMQYNTLGVNVYADKAELYGRSIDTKVRTVDFPAATTEKAGVMSAQDKEKLDEVIPDAYVGGSGTIPLCFAYVGWGTEYKEITVQKFNGISDTSIIMYLWNGESKTNITLQYSDAIVDGLRYTWKTDQYTIIVDFGRHSSDDRIQTSTKSAFLFKNKCFLIKDFSDDINSVNRKVEDLTKASKEAGKYISTEGKILNTSVSDIYLSEMVEAEAGTVIINARPIPSAENSYIHFYDSELNYLSYISEAVTTVAEKILTSNDIPAAAKYMRVALRESGYVIGKSLIGITDIFNICKSDTDKLRKIPKQQGYYINTKGDVVKTSVAAFWLSSYAYAEAGVIIRNAKPVPSASNSYIHFYDSNFNHLSYIASSKTSVIAEVTITEEDIPDGARYMRVEVTDTGDVFAKTLIDLNDIAPKTLGVPFDYATALSMDKNVLRNAVEAASAGKCTVLYDNDGYPSLMYRIPVMSVGAFSQDLGDFATPHPAFVVGGVRKNEIYLSVFQTCVYNGHYVSWFGLPSTASLGIMDLRQNIAAKGTGWHLETIYERSLLGLLTLKYNSPTPRGNTCWGRSSAIGYEYESVQMYNGKLPGQGNQANGAQWINGTQPHTWSHNKTAWGIQDVIGGYHEICDLVKMVDGFLYMAEDNNYLADESTWVNTGVAIDVIGENIFSTTITSTISEGDLYISSVFKDVQCSSSYDTLPAEIRKKMVLLLLAPRLLSTDKDTVLGINGCIQSRPAGVGYIVMGGAEEYDLSGLGYYNIAYDLNTVSAHNNMGSRLAYIK